MFVYVCVYIGLYIIMCVFSDKQNSKELSPALPCHFSLTMRHLPL